MKLPINVFSFILFLKLRTIHMCELSGSQTLCWVPPPINMNANRYGCPYGSPGSQPVFLMYQLWIYFFVSIYYGFISLLKYNSEVMPQCWLPNAEPAPFSTKVNAAHHAEPHNTQGSEKAKCLWKLYVIVGQNLQDPKYHRDIFCIFLASWIWCQVILV